MRRKFTLLSTLVFLTFICFLILPKKSEAISGNYNNFSYMNVDSGKLLRDNDYKTISKRQN